jgi:hypothetical protein
MAALRFGLKERAHPAAGGTPLLSRIVALPLNAIYNFETAYRQLKTVLICTLKQV